VARRFFGTDGVRGVYGREVTEDLVSRLGHAFATWSGGADVLIGRDTRASGETLAASLAAGVHAGGSVPTLGGILPTPAVALLSGPAGAVVSASHNPSEYNGVKFFRDGWKLADRDEEAIERLLPAEPERGGWTAYDGEGLRERYIDLVCERFGAPLAGVRIAVDCANGAMYEVAPTVFRRLGADIEAVGVEPDGANINLGCGATDLSLLARTVRGGDFDLGVAFDGDGDRVLAVDAEGREIDGDRILAILALHLGVELVAVTTMTNLGFHRLMDERGVRVVTTDVGDRYVLEALRESGGVLGGEQSGHVVYLDGHTTGDGLVAALLLARAVVERGQPLSRLASAMTPFPQARRNVHVRSKELAGAVHDAVESANVRLTGRGRVLVRASGTEPVVRVLAEAESARDAEDLAGNIAALVERELG
jgi:phosphoglucosamine mutase